MHVPYIKTARFQVVEMEKFFKMAWEFISKEHTETRQQISMKLATEEGLTMIQALTDEKVDGVELEMRLRIFKNRTFSNHFSPGHPVIPDYGDPARSRVQ